MRSSAARHVLVLAAATLAAALSVGPHSQSIAAEAQTKVILNGEAVPVFFNDGDTFRVLSGDYKGSSARLAGFNTLESYGPVHEWGDWTAKEMYVLAKMGTYNGRRGVWECETDGSTDTYGRILAWCPKLAEDQVRKGYAHVMTIDDKPGDARLIEAQKEAIAARRGIWAHGVPDYVLTSLHSEEEDVEGKGTYNRLVSSVDGHSIKWKHDTRYRECERVCAMEYPVDAAVVDELLVAAKADAEIGKLIGDLPEADARKAIHDFAKHRRVEREVPEQRRVPLEQKLQAWADTGRFGNASGREMSCMIHVPFERRFGGGKAECLK